MYVKYSTIPVYITPVLSDTVDTFSTVNTGLLLNQAEVMSGMQYVDSETDDSDGDPGVKCLLDANGEGMKHHGL